MQCMTTRSFSCEERAITYGYCKGYALAIHLWLEKKYLARKIPAPIFKNFRKIHRLGLGLNPQPWVQKASDKPTALFSRHLDLVAM
ncbi:hypothetical protein TNCV_2673031 [Trichonephila clavipes]|nr:hypothetical protein TNCV_2673031 [Trichonephila clavipes]